MHVITALISLFRRLRYSSSFTSLSKGYDDLVIMPSNINEYKNLDIIVSNVYILYRHIVFVLPFLYCLVRFPFNFSLSYEYLSFYFLFCIPFILPKSSSSLYLSFIFSSVFLLLFLYSRFPFTFIVVFLSPLLHPLSLLVTSSPWSSLSHSLHFGTWRSGTFHFLTGLPHDEPG